MLGVLYWHECFHATRQRPHAIRLTRSPLLHALHSHSPANGNSKMLPKDDDNAAKRPQEPVQSQDTNIWAKLDQIVRQADEEKVKDATANLDALLVFAGLYSAILTAFLIESYKNLQPDRKEQLLERIAGQTENYSFRGGYLNSTYDPSQATPFAAATSDIRVNVCWFASLILSLSTASFGILVRQWLREYLAIASIIPEERVRIRHYRARGLEDWGLFEITAFLPVLLQIAFALFFRRPLFFQRCGAFKHRDDEHRGLSARCPYKTTFLKAFFTVIRPHVRSNVIPLVRPLILLPVALLHLVASVPRLVSANPQLIQLCDQLRTVWENIVSTARAAVGSCIHLVHSRRPTSAEQEAPEFISLSSSFSFASSIPAFFTMRVQSPTNTESTDRQQSQESSDYMCVNILKHVFKNALSEPPNAQEEAEVRSTDHNDLAVFVNIDSLFLDDYLLSNVRDDLQRRPRPVREVLPFVAALVRSRAVAVAVGVIAQSTFALIMALTSSQGSIASETVNILLQQLSDYESWSQTSVFASQMVAISERDSGWPAYCLSRIGYAWQASNPEDAAASLRLVVHYSFVARDIDDALLHLLECVEHPNPDLIAPTPDDILVIFDIACIILHNYQAKHATGEGQIKEFSTNITRLLAFVFEAIPKLQKWLPDVGIGYLCIPAAEDINTYDVLQQFFENPHFTYALLLFLSDRLQYLSSYNAPRVFFMTLTAAVSVDNATAISILNACTKFFEAHTGFGLLQPLATLRLCYLILRVLLNDNQEVLESWHRLFLNAIACINTANTPHHTVCEDGGCEVGHTDLCRAASNILRRQDKDHKDQEVIYRQGVRPSFTVDEETVAYLEWCKHFHANKARIPDTMVDKLRRFVCSLNTMNKHGRKFWRIRRLEDLERDKKENKDTGCPDNATASSGSIDLEVMVPTPTEPTAGLPRSARRHAKSLFESFNSDFAYKPASNSYLLAPLDVHAVDSAPVAVPLNAFLTTAVPFALTLPSNPIGDCHERSLRTQEAQPEPSESSHPLPIATYSRMQPNAGGTAPNAGGSSPESTEALQAVEGFNASQSLGLHRWRGRSRRRHYS
ncbi:hypothetical protein NM688_g4023 [Phlebia brevispora]|uniref:Uncharacterized protein n=1 Tax=Phlebia brevispora TaxID=194682 RepID=A0ACC1T3X0_9APHY|nr:hypothetical protein NM688_g4023 [Phlebia brevispora]